MEVPIGNIGDDGVREPLRHSLLLVMGQSMDEEGGGGEGTEEGEGEGEGGGDLTHRGRLAEEEDGGRGPLVEEGLLRGGDRLPSLLEGGRQG